MAENIVELLTDVADAIRKKKGSTEKINAQNFASEIQSIETSGGGSMWTGHADAEGLRAIGWDDEDIAYYQAHGVNWNEEDDQYHLVSDDNKALYGVLTADNIQDYKDRIVYFPKIDLGNTSSLASFVANATTLLALPLLDTSKVEDFTAAFDGCKSLVCVPPFDTSNVTSFRLTFYACVMLSYVPWFDTSKAENMTAMFYDCSSLRIIPLYDTSNVTAMDAMLSNCISLIKVPFFNTSKVTIISRMLFNTLSLEHIEGLDVSATTANDYLLGFSSYSLKYAFIKGLHFSLLCTSAAFLTKESLLYIINNEAATEPITITLHSYAYERLAEDADVVAALANHPNVSLAK